MNSSFVPLRQRAIIDILIGDTNLYGDSFDLQNNGRMPYLAGSKICDISRMFGIPATNDSRSRWIFMDNLLESTIKSGKINELLQYLFDLKNFAHLAEEYSNKNKIIEEYQAITSLAIERINDYLLLSGKELKRLNNNKFLISEIGEKIIESGKITIINSEYIRDLAERCHEALEKEEFDTILTKSRTMMEEVLIYCLEQSGEEVNVRGDWVALYALFKGKYNMNQKKEYDKRINGLLSGLEKIIKAVAELRNSNSDAHGVGNRRINIKKREALLVINASMSFAEYILSVHEDALKKKFLCSQCSENRSAIPKTDEECMK